MTGILPIAKYSSGSPLNMFVEYTMIGMPRFNQYFGFTEAEVTALYIRYLAANSALSANELISYEDLKLWYDGYYTASGENVYNPRSINLALSENHLGMYWTSSGPYDEIFFYINHNLLDVKEDIYSAMLIYGMLTYKDGAVSIPNKELILKFEDVLRKEEMGHIATLAKNSSKMMKATLAVDTKTMEAILSFAHDTEIPIVKDIRNPLRYLLITS